MELLAYFLLARCVGLNMHIASEYYAIPGISEFKIGRGIAHENVKLLPKRDHIKLKSTILNV